MAGAAPRLLGRVYSLPVHDTGQASDPHPHVVALELDSEVLLIPAFSEGGDYVERKMKAIGSLRRVPPELAAVRLDNSKHVTFSDGREGRRAAWLIARRTKVETRLVRNRTPIGQMDEEGLAKIVEGLLALDVADPKDMSSHQRKKLKKLLGELRGTADA